MARRGPSVRTRDSGDREGTQVAGRGPRHLGGDPGVWEGPRHREGTQASGGAPRCLGGTPRHPGGDPGVRVLTCQLSLRSFTCCCSSVSDLTASASRSASACSSSCSRTTLSSSGSRLFLCGDTGDISGDTQGWGQPRAGASDYQWGQPRAGTIPRQCQWMSSGTPWGGGTGHW